MSSDIEVRGCRWIAVAEAADARGRLNFVQRGSGLDFQPQRLFWLHHIAPGQWRGRHAHRQTVLLFVALHGGCRIQLDDGAMTQTVALDDPARALYMAPWVWHELTDFAPGSAILVAASTLFDEADYLRDYQTFKRELPR
jgi:hypothetical protein